ncbi:unnamed protein product [Penicillium viridicatum]
MNSKKDNIEHGMNETLAQDVAAGEMKDLGEPHSSHTGELHRTFKARHIQMIALGTPSHQPVETNISLTGINNRWLYWKRSIYIHRKSSSLWRSNGHVDWIYARLYNADMMRKAFSMMIVLSEATCIFPTPGSFIDHAARFIDPAVGFATGFTEWFGWMTVCATEAAVARIILRQKNSYWTEAIPTPAVMVIFLTIVFTIHVFPNTWFAEFEFITGALKVIAMLIILLACIAILGGAGSYTTSDRGWNYREAPIFPNGFKGVCMTFTLAGWATGGQEIMGLTAAEAKMPRWNMPRACINLFARIIFFYELSVIFITLLVPYTNPTLLGDGSAANSPFVIAMNLAGIKGIPDMLNAIILLGLVAIGAESIYMGSRILSAMANLNMLPKALGRVDKKGRPYWGLLVTALGSTICTFINCSSTGGIIFSWFSSVSATSYFLSWLVISITNIQMRRAFKSQEDDVWKLPHAWKQRLFPLATVFLFTSTLLVLILTAYVAADPIDSSPSVKSFFQTCLGIPVWIFAFVGYKLYFRTKFSKPVEADLQTGRRPLSHEDIQFLDKYHSQPWWKRGLSYVTF